jgi:hypothetical protein
MKRLMMVASVIAVTGIVACSASDSAAPPDGVPSSNLGSTGGTGGGDSSAGGPTSNPTSNGPAVILKLAPRTFELGMGYSREILATVVDAKGLPVRKPVTWRSSNTAIVTVNDTGVVFGKALGTAKVYASIDGLSDSATVTVVTPSPTPTPTPTPTPGVAQFNLKVIVFGSISSPDTSQSERLPGATITLFRMSGVSGDSLSQPQLAGSAVTDANGEAKFSQLAGGTYSMKIVPPANSPFLELDTGFGPPTLPDITIGTLLRRK